MQEVPEVTSVRLVGQEADCGFRSYQQKLRHPTRLGNNGKKRRKRSRFAGWLQSYASAREVHFLTLFWWIKTV